MALQTLNDPWQGATGLEVENFIKAQLAELSGGLLNVLNVTKTYAPTSYNKDQEEYFIRYKVNNKVNNVLDSNWYAVYTVNGNQVGEPFYPSVYTEETEYSTPNLAGYLKNTPDAVDVITITVYTDLKPEGISVNTRTTCVYATVDFVQTTSNLNLAYVNRPNMQFITRYQGSSADLNVVTSSIFGGNEKEYKLANVTSNTTPKTINFDESESGVRVVDSFITLNGGAAESKHTKTEMICVDSNTQTGTFIATREITDAVVYEDATVYFGVYDANNTNSEITVQIFNAEDVKTAEVTISAKCGTLTNEGVTSSFVFTVPSSKFTVKFIKGNNELRSVEYKAETSEISWEIAKGAELYLTAKGRANNQVNADVWSNNGYDTTFTDVDFAGSNGWLNSQTLHLTGDAKAQINIAPLYDRTTYEAKEFRGSGITNTGRTIQFKYKVTNVNNQNDKIISCWDPVSQFGFYVRPDAIYAKLQDKEIVQDFDADQSKSINNRRFSANSEVEVTLTVGTAFDGGHSRDIQITIYINGMFAGIEEIKHTSAIVSQNSPMPITLGCSGANLDFYYIRVYNKCLTKDEVYHNYVMSLNSQEEIKTEYDKNNYDLNSLQDAIRYCKAQSLKEYGNCSIVVTTDIREGITDKNKYDEFSLQELWLIFFKNGQVDTTRTKKYVAAKPKGLRIRLQGTSTLYMPVKNLRYDAKGECYCVLWNPETDDWYDIEDSTTTKVTKLSIVLEEGDIPCKLLTTKTNYNESTATRNVPNAMWCEDAMNALYDYNNEKYNDLLTPPQHKNRKVRQCIKGIPAIQFYYDKNNGTFTFTGKVDMITDKKNSSVFGFEEGGEDHSIELRSNSADACNFHTSYLADKGWYTSTGTFLKDAKLFDFRWPDVDDEDQCTWNKAYNGYVHFGDNTPIQRLWDFVYNCSQDPDKIGKESLNGAITSHTNLNIVGKIPYIIDNGVKKYTVDLVQGQDRFMENVSMNVPDTAEWRRLKFFAEAHNYIVLNSLIFNGLVSLTHLWTDQRAKNTFFTHFKGDETSNGQHILRLLPYDIDTSWRGDNDSRLRYDYTREYTDPGIYDDNHSEFWQLMDLCFSNEYADMFADLSRLGFYSFDNIRHYYYNNQVAAYSSSIYNADTEYKYTGEAGRTMTDSAIVEGSLTTQFFKAHGPAIEDLDWFMNGRLYYLGGKYFVPGLSSDFTKNSLQFDIAMSHNFGDVDFDVTTYDRAHTYWYLGESLRGSGYSEKFEDGGVQHIHFKNFVTTASDNRINVYGQEQVRSFGDLSPLLIEQIKPTTNLNVIDWIIGSTKSTYENPVFKGWQGSLTYGACKEVNVANCTGYVEGDFSRFPILETLYATGCTSMVTCALPSSATLKYCYLPANLRTLSLENKYNVQEITIEGISNISSVTMQNCNTTVQNFIFDKILKPIYG